MLCSLNTYVAYSAKEHLDCSEDDNNSRECSAGVGASECLLDSLSHVESASLPVDRCSNTACGMLLCTLSHNV